MTIGGLSRSGFDLAISAFRLARLVRLFWLRPSGLVCSGRGGGFGPVGFAAGHEGPEDACGLVGHGEGDEPSQAAKWRPLRKRLASPSVATIAEAVIGPTPGTVISRRAVASPRAAATIAFSAQ